MGGVEGGGPAGTVNVVKVVAEHDEALEVTSVKN